MPFQAPPAVVAPPPKDATPLSGLVVEAPRRSGPAAADAVLEDGWGDVGTDPVFAQLARWSHAPCVEVLEKSETFRPAMERAWARLGPAIGWGDPNTGACRPDAFVIVVSGEPRTFLAEMKAKRALIRTRWGRFDEEAYERLVRSDAPVSVWRLSEIVGHNSSRTHPTTVAAVLTSITFVWAARLRGEPLDAVALYTAYVTAAAGAPEGSAPQRSLLNLFRRPSCLPSEGGLSPWDVGFLKALQETDPQAWLFSQLRSIALRRPAGEPCPPPGDQPANGAR